MNHYPSTRPRPDDHLAAWSDRLQDWLDGASEDLEAAAVQQHLDACADCRAFVEALQRVDLTLGAVVPVPPLDASFDARLYAHLDALDESGAAEKRRELEQELQRNLQALSRGWRRSLGLLIPGIVAGLAIAFALSAWLQAAGLTALDLGGGSGLDADLAQLLRLTLTACLGTALGLGLARWLRSMAE